MKIKMLMFPKLDYSLYFYLYEVMCTCGCERICPRPGREKSPYTTYTDGQSAFLECVVLGKSDELGDWYFDDDFECFYL
jgi:hypothetical protein